MDVFDVEKKEGEIICFLKFTSHCDSLLSGQIYMNNLKYFIDQEIESKIKGQGDKLEASNVLNDCFLEFRDCETNELVITADVGKVNFRFSVDEKKPVFCLFALKTEHLKVIAEEDNYYIAKIDFSKEDIKKMILEFGGELVFINPIPFLERLSNVFKEKDYEYEGALVEYDDFSINNSVRIHSMNNNPGRNCFWKDNFFKNQSEFRIVINNLEANDATIINIGDIKDIAKKMKSEDFFNSDKFKWKVPKNKFKNLK